MNAKPILKWLAAAAVAALAFPAAAADDGWFLSQMARTDGDALGQHYKAMPANEGVALSEADLAFLAQMQLTDGYVEPFAFGKEPPERTETASR